MFRQRKNFRGALHTIFVQGKLEADTSTGRPLPKSSIKTKAEDFRCFVSVPASLAELSPSESFPRIPWVGIPTFHMAFKD